MSWWSTVRAVGQAFGVGRSPLAPSIEGELWSMGDTELGSFVQQVPSPLCIGTVTLTDGSTHKGFLCESAAVADATDVTDHRSWRAYLRSSTTKWGASARSTP